MKNTKHKVVITGAGVIGCALSLIIREVGDMDIDIYIGDINKERVNEVADWITEDSSERGLVEPFLMNSGEKDNTLISILKSSDIILDCLPGDQSPRIARLAREFDTHYVNTSAYVDETKEIVEIAKNAPKGFILQTGLAPGFVNVLANGMFQEFCSKYGVDKTEHISMKVGALTKNAMPPHYYGFTWSPIGVAEEYFGPIIIIRNFKKTTRPPLSRKMTIIIDGITYEEAFTSGGSANLPEAFEGKTKNLDYKTLRYPGHYEWVESVLSEIRREEDKEAKLKKIMEEVVPHVEEDVVVIYVSVSGFDKEGRIRIEEKSFKIKPMEIGGKILRAIQITTAAPIAECARMLLEKNYKGLILQSMIQPDEFLKGPFVSAVYR
ncbi:saccharopine dehydrogenase NADP-binding domain-containing protein [bacterium]|nr:saccharopine dehydrogenase NADP-binding domain-containing protein [bacterium]